MLYVVKDLESLVAFSNLRNLETVDRLRIENYDDISKSKLFNLMNFPIDHGLTLEFIDCQYPLDSIVTRLKPKAGALTTVRYKFTRAYQRPINILRLEDTSLSLPFERLVVDFGSRIDCEGLAIENLVLYNLLSALHLEQAKSINTLVIVHSFNVTEEESNAAKFELPSPLGLRTLVIPESQEFEYKVGKTAIPDIIGIIPSSYYPSRFVTGIQHAREAFTKSQLPEIVYEVYSQKQQ